MGVPFDNGTTKSETNVTAKIEESTRLNVIQDEIKEEEVEDVSLESLAPDGGWGWMVALGMIVVFITSIGPAPSFTIVFEDFLKSTGKAGSAITVLNSVFNISFSFAGLMTNLLIKRYSIRSVGVVGALLYSVPNVLAALVQHFYELAALFLIQGIGLGLMFTICNTNFNAFFVKKRSTVMSTSQAIIGLGWIVYPIFIEEMMTIYGFRGTAAINGALSLNCIVGMTMMHPVEWHLKTPEKHANEKEDELKSHESQELISQSKRHSTVDYIHSLKTSNRWNSLRSLKEYGDRDMPLFFQMSKVLISSTSEMEKGSLRRKKKIELLEHDTPSKIATLTFSSSSLANLRMPIGIDSLSNASLTGKTERQKSITERTKMMKTPQKTNKTALSDLIDMSLLKNKRLLNTCLGINFINTSDFTFGSLLPLMMINSGYTQTDAALAITISATAELASRVLLAIFTALVDVRPKKIVFYSMILMSLVKIGYIYLDKTYTGTMLMIAAIGVVRSWLSVPQPLVVVEGISVDKFAAAYGICAIFNGIISTVFGSLVGFIRDWTDSYTVCQFVLLGFNMLFIIPWGIELMSGSCKNKSGK